MSWTMHHAKSSELASCAEIAVKDNKIQRALELYQAAATEELLSLQFLDESKPRTLAITAVSAVSLFFLAKDYDQAERIAIQFLAKNELPSFASQQLRELIQAIWNERLYEDNSLIFTDGEVLVSVSGGEVVTGGAPLELVLTKVNEISRYFYRTIEFLLGKPVRRKGNPDEFVAQQCRPWLFQAPPGSYQFSVRIQRPSQRSFFDDDLPQVNQITGKFIEIMNASASGSSEELEQVVPDEEYRDVFLKMTRNLAPSGKTFTKLEIRPRSEQSNVSTILVPESRVRINDTINKERALISKETDLSKPSQVVGVLRGLHLDNDWIEVTTKSEDGEKTIKIHKTGEVVDDIIGPMVNRRVVVDALLSPRGKYLFKDIQIDE